MLVTKSFTFALTRLFALKNYKLRHKQHSSHFRVSWMLVDVLKRYITIRDGSLYNNRRNVCIAHIEYVSADGYKILLQYIRILGQKIISFPLYYE